MNFVLRTDQARAYAIGEIAKLQVDTDKPLEIVVRQFKAKRSTPANALYWQWLTVMAKYFSGRKININADEPDLEPEYIITSYNKDDMHDLCRHKFLGYEDKLIGKTIIGHQLKSTTGLDVSQMHIYMLQIDIWAQDLGCYLPRPEDSDYEKYRSASI